MQGFFIVKIKGCFFVLTLIFIRRCSATTSRTSCGTTCSASSCSCATGRSTFLSRARLLTDYLTLEVNYLGVHIVYEIQILLITLNQSVCIHELHQQAISLVACLARSFQSTDVLGHSFVGASSGQRANFLVGSFQRCNKCTQ